MSNVGPRKSDHVTIAPPEPSVTMASPRPDAGFGVVPARVSSHTTIAPPAPSLTTSGNRWKLATVHSSTPATFHWGWPAAFMRCPTTRLKSPRNSLHTTIAPPAPSPTLDDNPGAGLRRLAGTKVP